MFGKTTLSLSEYLRHLKAAIDTINRHGHKELAGMPESGARAEHFEALSMLLELSQAIEGIEATINPEASTKITEDTIQALRATKPLLFTKIVLDGANIEAKPMDDSEAMKMLRA
jgi:hypothetical protein